MAHANMSLILDKTGAWNWSASDKVALSFVEKPLITNASNNIALIHVRQSTLLDLVLE